MAHEIERKFLVVSDAYRHASTGVLYKQGYLHAGTAPIVRVRICGEQASLTIKGATTGITRAEFEYEIPVPDAEQMLDRFCHPHFIEKMRYTMAFAGSTWEIDEFFGDNAGLVVAEIELTDEAASFVRPPWLGREVSDDPRYYNNNLLAHPFKEWKP